MAIKENVLVAEGKAAYLPSSQNYIVTKDGRIFNRHGRELTPYDHYGSPHVTIRINGKRVNLSISQVVYKTFIGETNGRHIIHKDGNNYNNSVDNLYIVPSNLSDKQLADYEKWALPSVKKFIAQKKINSIKGFDTDNFIGEACLYLFKYLSLYKPDKYKFITWGNRYINWAFKVEYKRFKTIIAHETRKDFLL